MGADRPSDRRPTPPSVLPIEPEQCRRSSSSPRPGRRHSSKPPRPIPAWHERGEWLMASLDPDLLRQARELIHNPNFELARALADNLEHVLNHVRADDVLTVVRAKALADAAVSSFDSARPNPSIYFAQLVSILENATKPPLRQAHELLLDRQFPSRQTTTLARSEPADNIGRGVLPVRTAHLIAFSASLLRYYPRTSARATAMSLQANYMTWPPPRCPAGSRRSTRSGC
jgi:hypothetical protein